MREVGDEDPKSPPPVKAPGWPKELDGGKDRCEGWSPKGDGSLLGGKTGIDLLSWLHPVIHLFNNFESTWCECVLDTELSSGDAAVGEKSLSSIGVYVVVGETESNK